MLQILRFGVLPAGLLLAFPALEAAEAAHCPAGQMYRVTLHKCVSKAGNLQFLRHARKSDEDERPVAKPAVKKVAARAAPAATPSKRETEVEDLASYAPTSAATKSNAAPSTPWPYGALR